MRSKEQGGSVEVGGKDRSDRGEPGSERREGPAELWSRHLFSWLERDPGFKELQEGLERGLRVQSVHGVSAGARAFFLAGLFLRQGRFTLVITPTEEGARRLAQDLQALLGEEAVMLFPGEGMVPFEVVARSPEITGQRLRALSAMLAGSPRLTVAPALALNRRLLPPREWERLRIMVRQGQAVSRRELLERLEAVGYERVDLVEAPGQYTARGDCGCVPAD